MTASKPKTPTASGISRLLAAAGFERADVRMRGGRAGFEARAHPDGSVIVIYCPLMSTTSLQRQREWLDRYAAVVADGGYVSEVATYEGAQGREHLIVTAKAED